MIHVLIITAIIIYVNILTGGALEPKKGPKRPLDEQEQSYRGSRLWPQLWGPLLEGRVGPEARAGQSLSWRGVL